MARGDEPRRHLTRGEAVSPRRQAPSWLHVVEGGDHSLEVGARALRGRGESQDDVDARALAATGKGFTLASRSLRRRAEEMRGGGRAARTSGRRGPGPTWRRPSAWIARAGAGSGESGPASTVPTTGATSSRGRAPAARDARDEGHAGRDRRARDCQDVPPRTHHETDPGRAPRHRGERESLHP